MLSNFAACLRFQPDSSRALLMAWISVAARSDRRAAQRAGAGVPFGCAKAAEPPEGTCFPGCVCSSVSIVTFKCASFMAALAPSLLTKKSCKQNLYSREHLVLTSHALGERFATSKNVH